MEGRLTAWVGRAATFERGLPDVDVGYGPLMTPWLGKERHSMSETVRNPITVAQRVADDRARLHCVGNVADSRRIRRARTTVRRAFVPGEREPDDLAVARGLQSQPSARVVTIARPRPDSRSELRRVDGGRLGARVADLDPESSSPTRIRSRIVLVGVHDRVRGRAHSPGGWRCRWSRGRRVTTQRGTGETARRTDAFGHRREHGLGGLGERHGASVFPS